MYNTCIFDLYGTLVDIHTNEEQTYVWEKLSLFYNYYGAFYTPSDLKNTYCQITNKRSSGSRFRQDSHEAFPELKLEEIFMELFTSKGIDQSMELAIHAGQFFRVLSTEYIRLYPHTLETLEALKKAGKKLYLLSNAQRIFTEYEMKALKLWDYFDSIFLSSDYGIKKPDPSFFQKLADTYNISPSGTIMIGNDGVCDIAGAKRAGWDTLYVHSNISPEETFPDATFILPEMDMKKIQKILLKGKGTG